MPSDIRLCAQPRHDSKWTKLNLQAAFHRDSLNQLWNELVKDGEILTREENYGILNSTGVIARKGENGRYYCGMPVLVCSCCDGRCGPRNGCNCSSCQLLDRDEERSQAKTKKSLNNATTSTNSSSSSSSSPLPSSARLIESWTWGKQPGVGQLRDCLQSIISEQQALVSQSDALALSSVRLQQQLIVMERYFVALSRHQSADSKPPTRKKQNLQTNLSKQKSSAKSTEKATAGLARVGSRAVLSFAFAFLRRAWRSGEDSDLCSELLQESLEVLRSLPEATLFDDDSVSGVWVEVVERSSKFLQAVVEGDVNNVVMANKSNRVPAQDRQVALALLLELAVQRGTLSSILGSVLLLLNLWSGNRNDCDNRLSSSLTSAPLIPLLQRFELISASKKTTATMKACDAAVVSPTECFLQYLSLPEDSEFCVDLRESAIVILAHLDRIATSFPIPNNCRRKVSLMQDVFGWGALSGCPGTLSVNGPTTVLPLCEIEDIEQLVAADNCLLVLTKTSGKVYRMNYSIDSQVTQLVSGLSERRVTRIASHPEARHYLALTADGIVYSWGSGDLGQLGHGDNSSLEIPTQVAVLSNKNVVQIQCGASRSAAITSAGELYIWGRSTNSPAGLTNDYTVPTLVAAFAGLNVTDIACGNADTPNMVLTNLGNLYIWMDAGSSSHPASANVSDWTPHIVEQFQGQEVVQVRSGTGLLAAITKDGRLYMWYISQPFV